VRGREASDKSVFRSFRRIPYVSVLLFAGYLAASLVAAEPAATTSPNPVKPAGSPAESKPYSPTALYDVRDIRGWRVLVHQDLPRQEPELCQRTMELLDRHLYDVSRSVPAKALAKLRQIAIWVERQEPHHPCMAYHPDAGWLREHDMNPEKAGCVEIAQAQNFLSWTLDQPSMVLHELAHGYHHRFLEQGFENPEVLTVFRHAQDEKLYDAVLRRGNRVERAYAMNNQMEYFAETSESFFGTNDFYPFVRVELQRHDPQMYELLKQLWDAK
jgi:hypothetical protein